VQLLASYALQKATDADPGAPPLTNSPRHMAKLRLSVPGPRPRSFGSFEWQYLSSRATLAGLTVDPAVVANATINLPINPSVMLTGQVRNLFNASYADPASDEHVPDSIVQDGRTIRLGVRWAFWRPK
jgi:outer membrane receptor protein involved in Fe transport